jgi:CheY-like chemotaxis protein
MTIYTVLCIEDNATNMLVLEKILASRAFSVLKAETAEDGLALAKGHYPDLILMDINLPGMDGFEALAHLRKDKSLSKIPVIAVTADMSKGMTHYIEAGFVDLVHKPITLTKLIFTLKRFGM